MRKQPILIKKGNNKEAMNTLLQDSRKSRGRPKASWRQADTARELGISQQAVSNCIQIARAVEVIPALAGLKGTAVLKALRILRNPDGDCSALADEEVRKAVQLIASFEMQRWSRGGNAPHSATNIPPLSPHFETLLMKQGGKT
jgi:hypothetical protein